jgi:hypothetical protein
MDPSCPQQPQIETIRTQHPKNASAALESAAEDHPSDIRNLLSLLWPGDHLAEQRYARHLEEGRE